MSRAQCPASVSPRAAAAMAQWCARKTCGARAVLPAAVLLGVLVLACLGAGPAVASPPSTAIRYVYDADGHLKGLVVPGSETALYGWDAAGNLTSVALKQSKSLSVIQLTPAQGAVGETVTISGTGFSPKPGSDTVKFNGTAATVSAATEWALTVTVPKGATSGTVSVQTSEGPVSSAQKFAVMASLAPTISSLSVSKALAGETITVNGGNFETSRVDDVAKVNESMPAISSVTSSSFQLTVPSATGGGHVSVATPQGSVVGPDLFIPPEGLPVSKVETTGRLSLGSAETFKLPVAEKIDLELFDGTEGQRVSMVLSESSIAHGYVSLWGPHGEKLTANEGFREGETVLVGPITLPSTGTYTIMVTPLETYTGSVKLQTYSVVDQTGEIKPTAEGAKAEVSITIPGQRAVFSVPGTAGEDVSLKTTSTSFTGRYYVEWFNAKSERIYSEWWNGTQNEFFPAQKFAGNETYTLIVRGGETSTGSTAITAYNASDVTGSITPSGSPVKVAIGVPGQKARITFSGKAGEKVSVTAAESSFAGGYWWILTPEGERISGTEVGLSSGETTIGGPITLASSGTYTVYVSPSEAETGIMTLRAYSVVDQTGEIKPTAEGAKAEVSITTPGQRAVFSVPGTTGEDVSLKTTSTSFTGKYYVEWYNAKGERIYSEWWRETQNEFFPAQKFAGNETYTLVVRGGEASTGSTTITAYNASDVTGSVTAGGAALKVPITVPGQKARITFSGKAGEKISVTAAESTFAGGSWWIITPEGERISGTEVGLSSSETKISGPITLASTGTYTVFVSPYEAGTGSVTLQAYSVVDQTGEIKPTAEGAKANVSITTPGQRAVFSVPGTAGEAVSLTTSATSFTGTYYVEWFNAKGELIYHEWWRETQNEFFPAQKFAGNETYTLVVRGGEVSTGSTTITVYNASDVTGSITPGGAPVKVAIGVPGQKARIKFPATEGQLLTLSASEVTIESGWMSIWAPEEKELSGSEVNFGGGAKDEFTPSSTGTYTILVNPREADIGSVTLTLYEGSHGPIRRRALGSPPAAPSPQPKVAQTFTSSAAELPLSVSAASVSVARVAPAVKASRTLRVPVGVATKHAAVARGTRGAVRRPRPARGVSKPLGYTRAMLRFRAVGAGGWSPPRSRHRGLSGAWDSLQPTTPWTQAPPLQGPEGETALAGQVLALDGLPLAGVRLSVEGTYAATESDSGGRFLLSGLPAGHQVLVIEGDTVPGHESYGTYETGVELAAGRTTVLQYTIWLTPLDRAGDHRIASPTTHEVRLTTPQIPGLEVRLPAGSVITAADGKVVHDLNITAVPVDRPPFPLPGFVSVPVYFTVQPGRAYVSKGAQIVYPNWDHLPPGQRVDFWDYDADKRGWYVYGEGTVTPDGRQVMPDPGVRVWEFSGAMISGTPKPPGKGPKGKTHGGDPVDLQTGLFLYRKTDLSIPDTIPIVIEHTYRQSDSNSYAFGDGTQSAYEMQLWSENNYQEADLVLPTGGRIHYVRISPGTGYSEAVYEATATSGLYHSSTFKWNGNLPGWELTLTDGTTYVFGEYAPLQAIRNRRGEQLTITRESGQTGNITQITSPHGRWVKFGYDGSNRITEVTDNGGRQLKYTYASGSLSSVTDAAGHTTKYEYTGSGQLKSVTDGRGKKYIETTYDANERVASQTAGDGGTYTFKYGLSGVKVETATITDPRKIQDKTTFNSEGYPVSQVNALGTGIQQTTTYEPEAGTGQLLSVTDPLGRKTAFKYDKYGNATQITRLAGSESARSENYTYEPGTTELTTATNGLGQTTKYRYGLDGELLSATDPLGHKTSLEYNAEGEPTAVKNALEKTTTLAYENGLLTSVTDPLGRRTSAFLDAVGRVGTFTRPGGQTTDYEYAPDNEIKKITDPLGAAVSYEYDGDGSLTGETDQLGNKNTAAYDPMDRLESETDALGHAAKAVYDGDGNITQLTDRRGKVSKFTYDSLNRLTEARYGVSGETAESTITYGYDNGNRLTKIVDSATGTYTLEYDEFNRLKSITTPTGTISYTYNEAEEPTSMSAPEQEPVKYTYDAAGRLTELKRGSQTASYTYDAANRRTGTKLVDGIQELYGYDEANELTSIAYKNGASTLGEIDYSYEPDGRREAMWGTYAHTALPETVTNATYNADEEQTKLNTTKLTYDLNGNLAEGGGSQYKWNARNQLAAISGANTATFVYDPYGRRVTRTINGITTKDLFNVYNVAQETTGGTLANLLTGLGTDEILALTVGKTTESYLTDILGSTVGLAGSTAKVQTKYLYGPFGTTKLVGTTSENIYQFAGRENDGDGLYYNRARYYNPNTGRFISQDPIEQAASGANIYLYTTDSPMNATDPYGTESLGTQPGPGHPPGFGGTSAPGGGGSAGGPGGPGGPGGNPGASTGGPGGGPSPGAGPGGPTPSSRNGGSESPQERLHKVEKEIQKEEEKEARKCEEPGGGLTLAVVNIFSSSEECNTGEEPPRDIPIAIWPPDQTTPVPGWDPPSLPAPLPGAPVPAL